MFRTYVNYVDQETGELITKYEIQNGEYVKIKTNTEYNGRSKTINIECRKTKQTKLF
jgi:hypothetical protein